MERGITTADIMKMLVLFVGVSNATILYVVVLIQVLIYRPRPLRHCASHIHVYIYIYIYIYTSVKTFSLKC